MDKKITKWVDDSKSGLMQDMLMLTLKASGMMTGTKQWVLSQRYLHSLFPAWGIDFTLAPNWDGAEGSWAVTTPPQEYNWGGSYLHATTGTDNPEHVKDIILALTANKRQLTQDL